MTKLPATKLCVCERWGVCVIQWCVTKMCVTKLCDKDVC